MAAQQTVRGVRFVGVLFVHIYSVFIICPSIKIWICMFVINFASSTHFKNEFDLFIFLLSRLCDCRCRWVRIILRLSLFPCGCLHRYYCLHTHRGNWKYNEMRFWRMATYCYYARSSQQHQKNEFSYAQTNFRASHWSGSTDAMFHVIYSYGLASASTIQVHETRHM